LPSASASAPWASINPAAVTEALHDSALYPVMVQPVGVADGQDFQEARQRSDLVRAWNEGRGAIGVRSHFHYTHQGLQGTYLLFHDGSVCASEKGRHWDCTKVFQAGSLCGCLGETDPSQRHMHALT
jgi:hypothetical protein